MKLKHLIAPVATVAAIGAVAGALYTQLPSCHSAGGLPDPVCTPGVVRTTDLNIICHQTTGQFRPPSSYTDKLKKQQIKAYGFSDTNPADYEEDHELPLEVGGDGSNPQNLWPEPLTLIINGEDLGAHTKDKFENYLHKSICSGSLTPQEAQHQIMTDWIKYYHQARNLR